MNFMAITTFIINGEIFIIRSINCKPVKPVAHVPTNRPDIPTQSLSLHAQYYSLPSSGQRDSTYVSYVPSTPHIIADATLPD